MGYGCHTTHITGHIPEDPVWPPVRQNTNHHLCTNLITAAPTLLRLPPPPPPPTRVVIWKRRKQDNVKRPVVGSPDQTHCYWNNVHCLNKLKFWGDGREQGFFFWGGGGWWWWWRGEGMSDGEGGGGATNQFFSTYISKITKGTFWPDPTWSWRLVERKSKQDFIFNQTYYQTRAPCYFFGTPFFVAFCFGTNVSHSFCGELSHEETRLPRPIKTRDKTLWWILTCSCYIAEI